MAAFPHPSPKVGQLIRRRQFAVQQQIRDLLKIGVLHQAVDRIPEVVQFPLFAVYFTDPAFRRDDTVQSFRIFILLRTHVLPPQSSQFFA
jgi:hypothetical protein